MFLSNVPVKVLNQASACCRPAHSYLVASVCECLYACVFVCMFACVFACVCMSAPKAINN